MQPLVASQHPVGEYANRCHPAYFERLQRNDPDRKKIAIVATAHYLARVMWAMLKHGTLWKEQPAALAV